MLLSSSFGMQSNQGAWAGTFPGENGKIAFSKVSGNNWDLYVMNSDGTEQTRLTNNPESDFNPDWSPDGTRIAFERDERDVHKPKIYVMNADGSGQTMLTDDGQFPS